MRPILRSLSTFDSSTLTGADMWRVTRAERRTSGQKTVCKTGISYPGEVTRYDFPKETAGHSVSGVTCLKKATTSSTP